MRKRYQFNVDLPPELHKRVKGACGFVGVTLGDAVQIGLRWLCGEEDKEMEATRERFSKIVQKTANFESPLQMAVAA